MNENITGDNDPKGITNEEHTVAPTNKAIQVSQERLAKLDRPDFLHKALEAKQTMSEFVRKHHEATLAADDINLLNMNPMEVEADQLANLIEWFQKEEEAIRERYNRLINAMEGREFSPSLSADRFR